MVCYTVPTTLDRDRLVLGIDALGEVVVGHAVGTAWVSSIRGRSPR